MKRVRGEATPDPDRAPRAFSLLADSPTIEETRLLELNLGGEVGPTMLFVVDGAHEGLADRLLETAAVDRAEITPIHATQAVLMVILRPDETPIAAAMVEAFTRTGVVAEMPVLYRDGTVRVTLVGESSTLQSVVETLQEAVSVEVREVGEFGGPDAGSNLSDRQREAVVAGLELGYYDVPRGATHRDVADRLDCSPSTASEHLQKAEAKLVRVAMEPKIQNRPPTRST